MITLQRFGRGREQGGVLVSWWLSYGVVILLPMIITLMVLTGILHNFEREVRSANSAVLNIIGREIDAVFRNTNAVIDEVFLNDNIAQVKYISSEDIDAKYRYQLWRIISTELPRYSIKNDLISNLLIYLPNSDMVLTNKRYMRAQDAYRDYFADSGLSIEEFMLLMHSNHHQRVLPLEGAQKRSFMYINSQQSYTDPPDMNVVIVGNGQMLNAILSGVDWIEKSQYFAVNSQDEIIMTNAHGELLKQARRDIRGWLSRELLEVDGVTYVVQSEQSQSGLTYLSMVPRAALMAPVTTGIYAAAGAYAVCLVLGAVLAALLIRRNYKPVAGIMRFIGERMGNDAEKNEFRAILSMIERTVGDNDELSLRLEAAKKESGASLLLKYLSGMMLETDDVRRQLEEYGVTLRSQCFAAVIVWVSASSAGAGNEAGRSRAQFAARNLFRERFADLPERYIVDGSEFFSMILGVSADSYAQLLDRLSHAKQEVLRKAGIDVAVSVSEAIPSFELLPGAYQKAMEALQFSMLYNTQGLILPRHEGDGPSGAYTYGADEEMALLSVLLKGDAEGAVRLMNAYLDKGLPALGNDMAQCLVYDLVGTVIRAAQSVPGDSAAVQQWVGRIGSSRSMRQTRQHLQGLMQAVCEKVLQGRKSGNAELKERAVAFIAEHITDPALSNALIADHLRVTPSYLSTLFKEQAGLGLNEYINRERIARAAALLRGGEARIGDIGLACGFSNDMTFIRVFKKYQGVTPGQYREAHRERSAGTS